MMIKRNAIVAYLVQQYFDGNSAKAAKATGFTVGQCDAWISGEREPHKRTVEYLIHCIFTPEFKVIVEFGEFVQSAKILIQLKELLKGHESKPGIYAFYDSMANLLYVGKATKLLPECCDAIRRDVHIPFPKGVKNKPQARTQIVRYISAYDVGESKWLDFPKHVESLILRISKPPLNKIIGYLEKAYVLPEEG